MISWTFPDVPRSTVADPSDLAKCVQDGNGTLDLDEMAGVFRVIKPALTFKDIAALMVELDTGGEQNMLKAGFFFFFSENKWVW